MEESLENSSPRKKIKIPSEIAYFLALIFLSLSVAMMTAADFGISMIVAPAYLLSLKSGFLSFGQAEYIVQAVLLLLLCLIIWRFRPIYLFAFVTCLIYGGILDLWRLIPFFNPSVTLPGSMDLWARIAMYIAGVLLTCLAVALLFKTYLYPQVYDFFVKAIVWRYKVKISIVKTVVDISFLLISVAMTFALFGELKGVNWGTLVLALIGGIITGLWGKILDKVCIFEPWLKRFAAMFELEKRPKKEAKP